MTEEKKVAKSETTTVEVTKLTLWERGKRFAKRHKKALIIGGLTVAGGGIYAAIRNSRQNGYDANDPLVEMNDTEE